MSSLLDRMATSNPIPPVITVSSAAPQEVKEASPIRPVKREAFDIELEEEKRFVIICSRDISEDDITVFRQHGHVLKWKKESFLNIDFEQLDFDFLLIDIREKEARLTLNRQDLSKYNKVAYVYAIQKGIDDFLTEIDAVDLSSIPEHAVNAKDFKHQLMTQKITAPSVAKSFLRFVVRCFGH
jgi:hypothetical protein